MFNPASLKRTQTPPHVCHGQAGQLLQPAGVPPDGLDIQPHPPLGHHGGTARPVEQRLGASRIRVRCLDGKTRVCRIPGRLKRKLWVREGDTVVVKPWEFGGDEKGDIIFKYRRTQVNYLKRQGYLKDLADFEEF